jgi:hypothetical protein
MSEQYKSRISSAVTRSNSASAGFTVSVVIGMISSMA